MVRTHQTEGLGTGYKPVLPALLPINASFRTTSYVATQMGVVQAS